MPKQHVQLTPEDRGEIIDFATDLEDEIRDWRNLQSQ